MLYLGINTLQKNCLEIKIIEKIREHCHYTGKDRAATHSIYSLKLNVPNEIPVVFNNCSNHDYHFIIKGLGN